jgi:hypothetical protein
LGKSDPHRVCTGETELHIFGKTIKPFDIAIFGGLAVMVTCVTVDP